MARTLNEAQVLKKLNITDFRHLTKDKVITMATMLDRMDPEVAKKALEQFPEFSSTMTQLFSEYKEFLNENIKSNESSVNSFYATCDEIIQSCQNLLENPELGFEERKYIMEQMIVVAKMKDSKDSENKHFIATICGYALLGFGFVVTLLATPLGSKLKIDSDAINKLA